MGEKNFKRYKTYKNKQKFIAIILFAVIIFQCLLSINVKAVDLNNKNNTGYIRTKNIVNKNVKKTKLYSIPPRYDSRSQGIVSAVKNQGEIGGCWAFAGVSALETTIAKQLGEQKDFSEVNIIANNGYVAPNEGGNDYITGAMLASWKGTVYENDDPYPNPPTVSNIHSNVNAPVRYHVQDIIFLPEGSSASDIKNYVYKYGSVTTPVSTSSRYYNTNTKSIYNYDGLDNIDHEVSIIGWDDSFSKNNFIIKPPADGAFIIKNSWGTGWGDGGYGYISYYDYAVLNNVHMTFKAVESLDNYEKMYMGVENTDPLSYNHSTWGIYDIDKYVMEPIAVNEQIVAIGIFVRNPGEQYDIFYEDDFNTNGISKVTNGSIPLKSVTFDEGGFRTLVLDKPISQSNKKFAFITKSKSNSTNNSNSGYNSENQNVVDNHIDLSAVSMKSVHNNITSMMAGRIYVNTNNGTGVPKILYQGHVQDIGWQNWVKDGEMAGTEGKSKRIEGLKVKIENVPAGLNVKYRTHVQDIGWQNWVQNGELAGTVGQSLRVEALQVKLEGTDADKYSIQYQVHVQDKGWMPWVVDGQVAGTEGQSLRIEAVRIKLVSKVMPTVAYQGHIQDYGWGNWVKDGEMAGTEGQSKRVEALRIKLENAPLGLNIKYQAHVQDIGWQNWVQNGDMAGTEGKCYRAEALRIELQGTDADKYSVEYQVHVQDIGWMPWVKDGEVAGTEGQSKRVEAVRIRIVKN
jgi:uncharacterized protein YjdB/C1A family cysteine protease